MASPERQSDQADLRLFLVRSISQRQVSIYYIKEIQKIRQGQPLENARLEDCSLTQDRGKVINRWQPNKVQ
jgi:hypothetical protein